MFHIKKIISILIVNCFLLSFVYGQVLSSLIANITITQQYKQIFNDFILPYSYGQITSSHFTSSDRLVINIQDLHCHPIVQKNISNIIELFNKEHEINNIYLEGAYGKVSTKWINQSIGSVSKNNIIEKMIETGRLTGAEYYSALSGKTEIIKGLEQREAYLDNLKRFGKILENQEKINKILEEIKKSTVMLKNKYYDRKQLKIEQLSNDYISGKITPEKYFALLSKHVDKLGIDIHKYNNTYSYMMLLSQQKKLAYKTITKELQTLVLLLKERIPYSEYKMLMDSTENFSKIDNLYVYLIKIAREYHLDLSTNFKELNKYLQYVEFSQKINPIQLIKEEQKLINEINTRFSETKVQREIVFLTNFEKYLEDYTTSKITSEDYEYYKNNIEKYRELWNKYVDNRVLSLLDQYLLEADKFYEINTERNKYFINSIFDGIEVPSMVSKTELNIIDNIKNVKRVDVIITGGFHTDSISKILEENNVSYIVITPNVTGGIKNAQKTYYQIAKEQSNISFQTLANLIASLSTIDQIKILQKVEPNLNLKEKYSLPEINAAKIKDRLDDNQINDISNLIINIKKAKLLESDDLGNIDEQIVSLICNNLGNETSLLAKVNDNLLEYINIDRLQQSLTDVEKLKRLITKAVYKQNIVKNDNAFKQTLLLYNSTAEDLRQTIYDLISVIKGQNKYDFLIPNLSKSGFTNKDSTSSFILPILQLQSTVQKLEEIGIDRYSLKGIVLGVIFETFTLWENNFLKQHANQSRMMKSALLIIKTFTILSAIFGSTCISPLLLSGVGLYSISGITGTAIVTLLTAITGEWIIHIVYNFLKIQDKNISEILQISDNIIIEEDINLEGQILFKSEYINNRDSIGVFLNIKDEYYYVDIPREGDLKLMSKNNDLFFNKMDQVFKGMYMHNFIKVQKQYDEENQKWKVIIRKGSLYFDDIKITLINKNKYFEQSLPELEKIKILLSNEYKKGLDTLGIMLDKTVDYSIIFLGALFGDDNKSTKEIIQQIDLTDKTVILYPIGVGADFNSLTNNQLYSLFTDNKNAFFIFMHDFIDNFLNLIASDMEQKERTYLSIDLYHFLYESLKNALVHGNNGDPNKPIYIVTKYDSKTKEYSIAVYNEYYGQTSKKILAIAVATGISGMHKGIENMKYSIEKLPLNFFAGQTKNNMYLTYLTNSQKIDEQYKIIKLGNSSVKEELNIDENINLKLEQGLKVIDIVDTSEPEDSLLYNQAKTFKTKKTWIDKYSFKRTNLNTVFETFRNFIGNTDKIKKITKFILVSINPISKIKNNAINIISLNEIQKQNSKTKFNVSKKLLVVNNKLIANKLREEGFNVVSVKIVENKKDLKDCVKISGISTQYNHSVVRVYWNSKTKEIVFYSKKGLVGVDIENLKQLLNKSFLDGIKNDIFYGIEQIIMTNELTSYDVINTMKNEYTYSVTMPLKEAVLNLSKKENLENLSNICQQEYKVNNIKIFVVNNDQLQKYASVITLLQEKGFKFILETTNTTANIILNGSSIDANNITDINMAYAVLKKLQELMSHNGTDTRIAIKFNEGILNKFIKENIDIWNIYGILPIVDKESKYISFGKVEIYFDQNITQQEIKSIYNYDNVIAIAIDDSSILSNDLINQIEENSTLKQQYAKGYNACLNSKFDYTTANVAELFNLISNDLINNENLAEILKNISTTQLSMDSKSYLEFLLNKEKYAEALGFIRGVSMNSIRKEIINILNDKNINIDVEKFEKESHGKYQKALLILAIQLIMSGKNLNDLLNDEFIDSDAITVKDYLESVNFKVNENIEKILRENEYFITKENNTLETISDFKKFNVLLQDKFRIIGMTKELKVSVLAIKNILSAA